MIQEEREFGFATRALHAGTPPDPATGSRVIPIYQTAAYVFGSTEQAAELFALRSYGHIYSRISNPTVAAFEERMANLEGGLGAVAFSSGLAAQLCMVLAVAEAGDHLICTQNVYGGTVTQLSVTVKRMGIATTFVPPKISRRSVTPSVRKPSCSSSRRSAIRRGPSRTFAASRRSRTRPASRSPSTIPLRRPTSAGRSNSAPISSCTPRRSSSTDTARRSAAC